MYQMAPEKAVALHALPGRKKQKNRFTVLVCCNADGSEKYELMFTGNAERPRAFEKKDKNTVLTIIQTKRHGWQPSFAFLGCNGLMHTFLEIIIGKLSCVLKTAQHVDLLTCCQFYQTSLLNSSPQTRLLRFSLATQVSSRRWKYGIACLKRNEQLTLLRRTRNKFTTSTF